MIWLLRPDQPKPREFAPAMTEPTEFLPGLPVVKGKPVHVAFDGGRLTSHAGIVLLVSLEQQLKIAERPSACLEDPRDPERIRHGLAEMIRYRALLIAARYPRACPGKGRGLVGGYHRYPDRRGLALPGRGPRPVHPQDSWLGDARAYARRTYHGRTDHGRPTAPSEGGLDPSRGSRQSVRCQRLSQDPAGRRHHPTDEPQAKLLGQRADGELLRHPEDRTRPSARIPRPRCRAARPVRVHRSLLQSSADPLRYRLHHPRAGRPENRITRCPFSRGNVLSPPGHNRAHFARCSGAVRNRPHTRCRRSSTSM